MERAWIQDGTIPNEVKCLERLDLFVSLRDWIDFIDEKGQLVHNKLEVDLWGEIAAISRKIAQVNGPAVLHHNVNGYPNWKVFSDGLTTIERFAWALGEDNKEGLAKALDEFYKRDAIKPNQVNNGPCKETKLFENDIDLTKVPIPFSCMFDSPPFITAGLSSVRDPETGWQNTGIRRFQLKGKKRITNLILPGKDEGLILEKYTKIGKPMPIAVVVGADPAIYICSVLSVPKGIDEIAAWGKLTGKPMEVVKCETSDILVPSNAEIIIEGEIDPEARELEGPYVEFTGYASGLRLCPVVNVKAITMRKDPIFQFMFNVSGAAGGEGGNLANYLFEASMLSELRALVPEVKDVGMNFCGLVTAVSIDKKAKLKKLGIVKKVGMALKATKSSFYVKNVIVVDDDVDVHNLNQLLWCLAVRYQSAKDTLIVQGSPGSFLDPSEPWHSSDFGSRQGYTSYTIFDCTEKLAPYDETYKRGVADPSNESIQKVEDNWQKYGFK